MTMAQSNSMGAKSDLVFQLFFSGVTVCGCASPVPLASPSVSLSPCCFPSRLSILFLLSSLPSCVFHSFSFACAFLSLLSSCLILPRPFLSWDLFPCLFLLSASVSALTPLSLIIVLLLIYFFLSHYSIQSPSLCPSIHLCPSTTAYAWFLEVWDSWTSLNFKALDDGGNIKVKW